MTTTDVDGNGAAGGLLASTPMQGRGGADTLVIVNPASAGSRTGKRWPALRDRLSAAGVNPAVHHTAGPRDATTATREALRAGYRRVVGVGGDGTLNELINGYFNPDGTAVAPGAALGLIPSGTGGDFRRTTGQLTAEAAVSALAADKTTAIDVGRIDIDAPDDDDAPRHYFLNIADWGVGGDVVARVNRSRFKAGGARGTAVFLGISLAELLTYGLRDVELSLDGEVLQRQVSNVVVANGRYFGGGMQIAPKATLTDGRFDVVIVGAMSRLRTLTGMPRIYRGSHLGMPGIEYRRVSTVRIVPTTYELLRFEAEGELLGAGAATVTCLPGAVKFIA